MKLILQKLKQQIKILIFKKYFFTKKKFQAKRFININSE